MRLDKLVGVLVGVSSLVVGCGGADHSAADEDVATRALPDRPPAPVATDRTTVSWTAPDGGTWPLDVVFPVEAVDGGWPVLVTFHGAALGTSASDMSAVAASGAVVVGPRWVAPDWTISNLDSISADDYVDGARFDVAKCALGAAQRVAAQHGGNPDRTTVEGFSAGAHPAAWVGLGVVRDDPCPDVDVVAPIAMVVGDGQWLFEGFGGEWDATFVDPSSRATDTVDRFLNAARWNVPGGFRVYLWSSESKDVDRAVDDPPGADSWLRTRGGDDLIVDLAAVDAFDDGSIGFLDNMRLQELRMSGDGIDVLHEQLPGDHSRKSQMIDRTIELVWDEPWSES